MDWTEIARHLEECARLYKGFQDGEQVASRLASVERARDELQAQYDALTAQIAQAKVELQSVKDKTAQALADGAKQVAEQAKAAVQAARDRATAAQADQVKWEQALTSLKTEFEATRAALSDQLSQLMVKIQAAKDQVAALEQIKESLKAQLHSVT